MQVIRSISFALAILAVLAGCQSTQSPQKSGFLKDYAMLKPDPDVDNALRYINPATPLGNYNKFMVDPIIVHFAPNAEGTAIAPNDLKELSDYFHNAITGALSKKFQVVATPGPGTARLRIAITGIEKTTPLLNIHPLMKFSGAGLGGASMEGEAIDTQTGKRIAALVDTREGDRFEISAGLKTYGHAKQVMEFWVERMMKNLTKAHGGG